MFGRTAVAGDKISSCLRTTEELPTVGKKGSQESDLGVGGQRLPLGPHLSTESSWGWVPLTPMFPLILPP